MTKRGRPPHPDILTPREWEVLALLREGLSNEAIAGRLDITERTARYHVSEILSKLGVGSREEAAAWQPEERHPRWLAAGAPFALFWRKASFGWLSPATAAVLGVVVATGAGLLVWGLVRTDATLDSPDGLVWERADGRSRLVSVEAGTCGDTATAEAYDVPMMINVEEDTLKPVSFLGLEAEPYEYVPAQVRTGGPYSVSPVGWELSSGKSMAIFGGVNRFGTGEVYLRRLDQPSLLFRYSRSFCGQEGGYRLTPRRRVAVELPDEIPRITVFGDEDSGLLTFEEAISLITENRGRDMQVVTADRSSSGGWIFLLALGDSNGPKRQGHDWGLRIILNVDGKTVVSYDENCCIDLVAPD